MAGDDEVEWDDEVAWGHFPVPPPPPPPALGPVCELQHCRLGGGPMGAHFNRAAFPSLPIVAVCSSVVLVAVLVASFLLWRHKTKVQNLLPCKNEQQGHLGDMGAANGVTYEDVLINHHPTRIPQGHQTLMPLEILDLKLGEISSTQLPTLHHPPCYPASDLVGGKTFNPVYEEVSQVPGGGGNLDRRLPKGYGPDCVEEGRGMQQQQQPNFSCCEEEEEEFVGSGHCSATSSVRGSTGGDLCRDPVSSDEGNGEDCEFMVHDLPRMLPGEGTFSYPDGSGRDRRNYPHPQGYGHRTADPPKMHSSRRTPSHAPSHPSMDSSRRQQQPQWRPNVQNSSRMNMNFPTSASQENIYSTIDEDDLGDHQGHYQGHQRPPPSLARPGRGVGGPKGGQGSPDRGDNKPVLSQQRGVEENGSSYGDLMPAFHSNSFM